MGLCMSCVGPTFYLVLHLTPFLCYPAMHAAGLSKAEYSEVVLAIQSPIYRCLICPLPSKLV